MDKFPHWVDHIVAFFFCVAVPLFAARQRIKFTPDLVLNSDQKKNIYITSSFSLFLMGAITMAVWLLFKRPIAEIGLTQPTNTQSWLWLAFVFVIIYILDAVITLSNKKAVDSAVDKWKKRTPFLPTKTKELPEYLLLCFSAGVFEEIVYRGYLVTYCWYLFEGRDYQTILSILLPAFVFSIAHFYQGTKAVFKIFILAIIFGYIFIYSGSLLIVMVLHFLVDAIGGLLTMKYMKEEAEVPQLGDENNFY
ncbi:MAG TPA: type II CAAX endopeptidase family protein [Chitinophagaceae bacterium]|nr:type II CAAX endopeptidase family protein [Chitinophagaceae bacterium]